MLSVHEIVFCHIVHQSFYHNVQLIFIYLKAREAKKFFKKKKKNKCNCIFIYKVVLVKRQQRDYNVKLPPVRDHVFLARPFRRHLFRCRSFSAHIISAYTISAHIISAHIISAPIRCSLTVQLFRVRVWVIQKEPN